jgi:hypothetical protein
MRRARQTVKILHQYSDLIVRAGLPQVVFEMKCTLHKKYITYSDGCGRVVQQL